MSPGESYNIPPHFINCYQVNLTFETAELRVNSLLFNAVNESSFETVN